MATHVRIVVVRFNHRLEERPFLGVGKNKDEAVEDALRFARFHWNLGEGVNMGLVVKSSWRAPEKPDA